VVTLQRPSHVYMRGGLVEWDDATIHVGAEALIRGISIFEGIKAYWSHDGAELGVLALRSHYERLQHLPFEMDLQAFSEACLLLVRQLMTPERDIWLRPTVYAVEGHWGEFTVTDLAIMAYQQDKKRPDPIRVGVSTWQRPFDNALPTRIKSAANYQVGRLARIEGRRQGFDDMILLNPSGRVSEATASCVLMVRDGRFSTPPPHEGCLESITINIIEALCNTLGIPFERRPIERTELVVADAVCLVGTLMELGRVTTIGEHQLRESSDLLEQVTDEFWAALRSVRPHPAVHLTTV
jgi:branched-chain amino acid aminotransferase